MISYRNFFRSLLVVGLIVLPAASAVDFFWKQKDPYAEVLLKTFNSQSKDVLFFGDSSIRYHGRLDKDTNGIDQLFHAKTGLTLCSIVHAGFSPLIYSRYIHLLDKTAYKPKLVIIPLNMRSFTGPTQIRPSFNFPIRQLYIKYQLTGKIDLLNYLRYRFLALEERQTEIWKKQDVIYNGQSLGTHKMIQEQSHIPEELDYAPEREPHYAEQLGIKFRYHYMAPLDNRDEIFGYLDDIVRYLKKRKISVLFYITPINFDDGRKYAGETFTRRAGDNIKMVEQFMKERHVGILNLSTSLDPSGFIDKSDAYEHYNSKGREFVSESLARAVQGIVSRSAL